MIKPINGLDIANHSGIASRNGSKSRLRLCEGAPATAKSVALPRESSNSDRSREL